MQQLRTIPRFVQVLVAMFIMAQFSGVVPSPRSNAQPVPDAIAQHMIHARTIPGRPTIDLRPDPEE